MAKPLEFSNGLRAAGRIQQFFLNLSAFHPILGDQPHGVAPRRTLPLIFSAFRGNTILVMLWMALGLGLRLRGLDLKPAWGDEWSTLVFSLGNGYHSIPLNEAIDLETLLQPLQPPDHLQFAAVIDRLRTESNHPPLFFLLLHLWLSWFPPEGGFVSIAAARLFSVILGVAAIPLTFILVQQGLRSGFKSFTSHFCALLMAISPFGVYLAQEARHYTLSVLWILGLLFFLTRCLTQTIEVQTPKKLSWGWVFGWIVLNSVGLATHFFYGIALVAAGGVMLWHQVQGKRVWTGRLWIVAAGTIVTARVWIPVWQSLGDSSLTQWLGRHEIFAPLGRLILWMLTTIMLLPVEGVPQPIAIVSGLILGGGLFALLAIGRRLPFRDLSQEPGFIFLPILLQFVGLALGIFLILIYGLGNDLSLAPRYQFVYFPGVILAFGFCFSYLWITQPNPSLKPLILGVLLLSVLGSLSVTSNWAYQKSEQSDRFLSKLMALPELANTTEPWLITTAHRDHGDTGRLMGLAWQWNDRRQALDFPFNPHPQFVLAHWDTDPIQATQHLHTILQQQTQPYQLGIVNFSAPHEVEPFGCEPLPHKSAPGYWSRFYHCVPQSAF